ncbi:hypothetical protein CAPTEDRAFT_21929 [Capitella teleta]|uniref:Uncharacterized protein n=2 Tax=Capitella teleta TaxID=283909 RepID=R7TAF4_CAPTE|nr:hypothetical protein CAPTEDRAFT_21929 [Capitella teleta]|eukprot:ELT90713.1 hypothetical protein CAPTEDRAFT_21929 [Capitella teleta]
MNADGIRARKAPQSLAVKSVRAVSALPANHEDAGKEELEGGRLWTTWVGMDVRLRFTIIDSFLSFFLFTPLVLVYWYGVYGLLDRLLYVLSVPDSLAAITLLIGGIYFEVLVCFLQKDLQARLITGSTDSPAHYVVTRLFNLVLSVANIAHYRALELIFQDNINVNVRVALQVAVTVTVLLWSLKCGRNVVGPPLCVEVDTEVENVFQTSTRFRTEPEKSAMHLLDTLASVAMVTTLVHLHWISITAVCDYVIHPNNTGMSIVMSSVYGYIICFVFILAQGPARRVSASFEKKNHWMKIAFEDAFFCGANVGVILVWKGLGMFFGALGDNFPIYHNGNDVTWLYATLVPFVLLTMVHSSGTLVTKGCDVDGDFMDGEGINFSISYFAGFFAEEIQDEIRRQEAARVMKMKNNNNKKMQ